MKRWRCFFDGLTTNTRNWLLNKAKMVFSVIIFRFCGFFQMWIFSCVRFFWHSRVKCPFRSAVLTCLMFSHVCEKQRAFILTWKEAHPPGKQSGSLHLLKVEAINEKSCNVIFYIPVVIWQNVSQNSLWPEANCVSLLKKKTYYNTSFKVLYSLFPSRS